MLPEGSRRPTRVRHRRAASFEHSKATSGHPVTVSLLKQCGIVVSAGSWRDGVKVREKRTSTAHPLAEYARRRNTRVASPVSGSCRGDRRGALLVACSGPAFKPTESLACSLAQTQSCVRTGLDDRGWPMHRHTRRQGVPSRQFAWCPCLSARFHCHGCAWRQARRRQMLAYLVARDSWQSSVGWREAGGRGCKGRAGAACES